ncbi:GAF domain-containing protein [Oscillatoria sp. FACHB-1406]|uniref:GAF domain-containing protein n=1 Tax=Oscillatoria sp. FACHB-1406 TaxID=2692846 RepID=UPI0016820560|nr:GAF domain-containing protein [Oscillatoria sp. FACHB-1406]MBD2578345.1 GAF domain-containing protein [Oscillatoria sp. FACHB-1406]
MAVYPQQTSPEQNRDGERDIAVGQNGKGQTQPERPTAAVSALRSQLEQAGLLSNPQIEQYWQQIEQLTAKQPEQNSFKLARERWIELAATLRACPSRNVLLETAVTLLRQTLDADRAIICQIKGQQSATLLAEARSPGCPPLVASSLPLACFGTRSTAELRDRGTISTPAPERGEANPYIGQTLQQFQIQSQCCAPILLDGQVWGILALQSTQAPRIWQESELNLLLAIATELTALLQPLKFRFQLQQQIEREKTYDKVVEDLASEDRTIDELFLNTCQEVRQRLRADRAIIYRFNHDWSGEAIAESVGRGWISLLSAQETDEVLKGDRSGNERSILRAWGKGGSIIAKDTYLQNSQGGSYSHGQKFTCVNDVYAAGFSPCYLESLEKYQVRAYVIVPIFHDERLWGLICVYQNSGPRTWQDAEVQLVVRLSAPLGAALQKSASREQIAAQSQKLATDAKQDLAFIKTIERLWQSLDVNTLFQTAVDEVRQLLQVDRVLLYRFADKQSGDLIAESAGKEWSSLMQERKKSSAIDPASGQNLYDAYFRESGDELRRKNAAFSRVDDIETAGIAPFSLERLKEMEARACILIPIFQPKSGSKSESLWGLLGVYQNRSSREWQQSELNLLVQLGKQLEVAMQQAEYVAQLERQTQQLSQNAERDRALAQIVDRIRSSPDIDSVFRNTVRELRGILEGDRVMIYRFNPDWSGIVLAESVGAGWVSLLNEQDNDEVLRGDRIATDRCILRDWSTNTLVEDTYLQTTKGGRYRKGESYTAVSDIYEKNFPRCYVESLEKYQARAYIIAPVFQGEKLWGLLGIYQNSGPRAWTEADINLVQRISLPLGLAIQQAEALTRLSNQAKQEQVLSKLLEKIQQAPGIDTIFRTTCQDLRQLLSADRTAIYRFNADMSGEVLAEAVGSGWTSLLIEQEQDPVLKSDRVATDRCILRTWATGSIVERDTYLQETGGGKYARGVKFTRIDDIYNANFPSCYTDTLEKYQARAYVIVPIFQGENLWGLLCAYQNSGPRQWLEEEVQLMTRLSVPLGVALQQIEALDRLSEQSSAMAAVADREKAAKELFQQRAIQILMAIRPSFEGDLTVRAPITDDEMGTIADAYNNAIKSLRRIVVQVKEAADKVGQTSNQSEAAIEVLSTQAQDELRALKAALEQIENMVAAASTVAGSAKQVELALQQARSTVQTGDTAMNRTVEGFSEIRKTVAETSQKIKRLGESSQKITKVVNLIGNFATQTNLLALNAAIEATRAGEYGRGFAVVADEVRSLARQSEEATSEIEKLVLEIQQETSEVAAAMERGIQQVVSGTNLVNETRASLNAIVEATAEIGKLVENITLSTQAQTQQSQSVTQTMENVAAIAQSTSESALQIAASIQALLATAEELQDNVGQFKVE